MAFTRILMQTSQGPITLELDGDKGKRHVELRGYFTDRVPMLSARMKPA